MTRLHTIRRASLLVPLAVAAIAALAGTAAADTADRQYLADKLSFRYVAVPNNVNLSPAILDNAAIAAGTESGTFWSNNKITGLQRLVRSLLRASGQGGDDNLQFVVSRVLKILDRKVMIVLLDDTGPRLTNAAMNQWDACDDGNGRAWPCASNASTTDDQRAQCAQANHEATPTRRDADWAGSMTLGQSAFNAGNAGDPVGTFVHELVHTQDRSDRREHMFLVSLHEYSYGSDGTHYDVEAMPNLAATYQEGIANAVMMTVDGQSRANMFNWFAKNEVLMVEKAKVAPGTGAGQAPCWSVVTVPSDDIWLYNQLVAAHAHEIQRTPNPYPGYAYFRIRDIPPKFIVHNEMIIALIFSEYARHFSLPKFLAALKANDATLFRVSTSPVAQLYNTLCTAGLEGRPLSSVLNVNEAGPKPYLIPLAYADYFTGYSSRTKADFASIFEGMLRPEWVDLYWDGYKDAVRAAAPYDAAHPPRFEQLTDIAISLGVTSQTAE